MVSLRSAVAAGAALGAYSLHEARRYRLAKRVAYVDADIPPLRILHVSDTHLGGGNGRLKTFLDELPEEIGPTPDLVFATGDLIEGDSGIEPLVDAMARLDATLGRFYVLGSHDYYAPDAPTYSKYFTGKKQLPAKRAATQELVAGLDAKGWISATNTTRFVELSEGRLRIAGVDDPYLERHDTGHLGRNKDDLLAIGLMHSPDVVSDFALQAFDLLLAGHTHGGQVRLPLFGAVVTNCSVPTGLAGGLNRVGHCWLHVSPGLGTSRFAPIRFLCPPEATLIHLLPARAARAA